MAVKSIEDAMLDDIGKQIAKEIDEGIISTLLVDNGWTPVQFYFKNNDHANDVTFWLLESCRSKWRRLGSDYLFESKEEAEWFILRWS